MRSFVRCLTWAALFVCLLINSAWAASEREPNDSCRKAQTLKKFAASTVSGFIDYYDADYFKISRAEPHQKVQLVLTGDDTSRHAALTYPSLWVYNSSCTLISSATYLTPDFTKLVIEVPEDGQYVVEVTGCCDADPSSNFTVGGYVLTSEPYVPPAKVYGTVFSTSGEPVPFAWVTIYQCLDGTTDNCTYAAAWGEASPDGQYSISTEYLDPAPVYQLEAHDSDNTMSGRSMPFTIGQQDIHIDLALESQEVELLNPHWTGASEGASIDITSGQSASVSVTLKNLSNQTMLIDTWLSVYVSQGDGQVPSLYQYVPASGPPVQIVSLPPGSPQTIAVPFSVPSGAKSGVFGYVALLVSAHGEPLQTLAGTTALYFAVTASGSETLTAAEISRRVQRQQAKGRGVPSAHDTQQVPRTRATP